MHFSNAGREVRRCLLLSSEAREKRALCYPALEMSSWTGREFYACFSPEAEAGSVANGLKADTLSSGRVFPAGAGVNGKGYRCDGERTGARRGRQVSRG